MKTQPHPVTSELDDGLCSICGHAMSIPDDLDPTDICNNCAQNEVIRLRAELNRRTPPAAGQSGWALYPKEPTQAMRDAYDRAPGPGTGWWAWKVMTEAAPPPPAAAEGKREWMPVTEEQTEAILDAYQEAAMAARYHGLSEAVDRMRDAINSVLCPPASAGDA